MVTRRVRVQLAVFAAMATIASCLIFFHYAKIPTLLGVGQTEFQVDFSKGAGLYPHANVTYRGVTVGKVTGMELNNSGITADLSVTSSSDVPRDVTASIKSVSAIGEQYVDLVPKASAGGQRLQDGDHIAVTDTTAPVQIAQVLDNVDTLLKSVPQKNLTTVLDEAEKGFRGLGPDLAQITRDAQDLIRAADANYDQTHQLIQDAEPVLNTQVATSRQIRSWAADLNGFTTELRKNDRQVRQLFSSVPLAAQSASGLLDDLSQQAPRLIQSADVMADLLKAYYPSVEQVLTVYPLVSAADIAADTAARGRQMGLAFKTIANYPGDCSEGWPKAGEPYGSRSSTVVSDSISAPNAYCRIPQGDPRVVRGARNIRCSEPGSPPGRRAALITQCRGGGYTQNSAPFTDILVNDPLAPLGNTFLGLLSRNASGRSVSGPQPWQSLLAGSAR